MQDGKAKFMKELEEADIESECEPVCYYEMNVPDPADPGGPGKSLLTLCKDQNVPVPEGDGSEESSSSSEGSDEEEEEAKEEDSDEEEVKPPELPGGAKAGAPLDFFSLIAALGLPADPLTGMAPWCSWAPPTPCIMGAIGFALEMVMTIVMDALAAAAAEAALLQISD